MALSGSFDYVRTADQLIEAAMRKLGLLAEGQSATTNQKVTGTEALNIMLKAWQAQGNPVWNVRPAYIYPIADTNTINLGNASGMGHFSDELILTKLTAAALSSATSITVSITAAVDVVGTTANSDNIGIELDDGTVHWTTISGGGGTTALTLATGLAGAAASGNRVYAYTSKDHRPEAVLDVWRVEAQTGARIEVLRDPYSQVRGNVVLSTEGVPLHYNYQEAYLTSTGSSYGIFRFWPRFQNGKTYLELNVQHPFDDVDTSSTDNIAFPNVWYEAVIYNLADRLAPENNVDMQKWTAIKAEAKNFYDIADEATTEGDSLMIQPMYDPTRRN